MQRQTESSGLYSRRGNWVLPIGDGIVQSVSVDFSFNFNIDGYIDVRVNVPFTVESGGAKTVYSPDEPTSLGPLLALHQARVIEALARMDGRLTVRFSDDLVLEVLPDEQYEAFEVRGRFPPVRREFTMVAIAGGGLARFDN